MPNNPKDFPGIPTPRADAQALQQTAVAMKQALEVLIVKYTALEARVSKLDGKP